MKKRNKKLTIPDSVAILVAGEMNEADRIKMTEYVAKEKAKRKARLDKKKSFLEKVFS